MFRRVALRLGGSFLIRFARNLRKKKKVIGLNGERGVVIVSSCIRHGGGAGRCLGMALITQ